MNPNFKRNYYGAYGYVLNFSLSEHRGSLMWNWLAAACQLFVPVAGLILENLCTVGFPHSEDDYILRTLKPSSSTARVAQVSRSIRCAASPTTTMAMNTTGTKMINRDPQRHISVSIL